MQSATDYALPNECFAERGLRGHPLLDFEENGMDPTTFRAAEFLTAWKNEIDLPPCDVKMFKEGFDPSAEQNMDTIYNNKTL